MNTLTENTVQALGWMLVHFLWQGLVVAVIFALARGLLRDARHRYAAGCLAMLALVAMPALTLLTSDFESGSVSAGPDLSGGTMVANSSMSTIDAESLRPAALSPAVLSPAALAEGWTLPVRHAVRQAMPAIVLCWLAGVLFLSLRLVGGGWICWRLKRRGVGPFPEGFRLRALNLAKCMNVRQRVRMLTSSIADVPMVIGVFRPAILLPASMLLGLAPDQLEAILVHELAHIRRHDNLVNLVQRLVETVFFFHPAAWWVSACIRTEREHCCDDIAAAASDARAYAGALTTLEELRSPALAVAATDGSLSSRVRRVLGFRQPESRQGWMGPAIASAMVMAAVTVLVPDAYVSASPSNTTEGDKPMNVTVDVAPTKPHAGTTLAASLSPLMADPR